MSDETKILFGLEAQGHIPTIKTMLAEGADWQDIGRRIKWDGETAKEYYERYLTRAASAEAADALAAKDREIAELRTDCVRKDDHLLAAVQDYNDVRQRTIEECIEAIYAFIERDKDAQVIPYIAAAIRSLGKEGSGEQ